MYRKAKEVTIIVQQHAGTKRKLILVELVGIHQRIYGSGRDKSVQDIDLIF